MPPAALHHFVNASAASNSSRLRPGACAKPGSEIVATWISVSVTPTSVAPLPSPGPQTSLTVPKLPWASAPAALDDGASVEGASLEAVDSGVDAGVLATV